MNVVQAILSALRHNAKFEGLECAVLQIFSRGALGMRSTIGGPAFGSTMIRPPASSFNRGLRQLVGARHSERSEKLS